MGQTDRRHRQNPGSLKEETRMPLLRNFAGGLRDLFRKRDNQQELDEELRDFLEAAAEDKMRFGMTREQAVRAARVEMGSAAAVKDQVHQAGWESRLES